MWKIKLPLFSFDDIASNSTHLMKLINRVGSYICALKQQLYHPKENLIGFSKQAMRPLFVEFLEHLHV